MFKKIVYRLLEPRHYWRKVGFDELSEIYVATIFRGVSLSLMGLFVPLFMLRLHYSVTEIMSVFACYFTFRIITDICAGYTVARIGPKHSLLIGYGLQIVSSLMFMTLNNIGWPLWLLGCIWGASASYYFVPFNVDFSKIKHKQSGGKELGFVNMMEKIGAAIGPVLGGIVATIFGGQYTFLIAVVLLVIGASALLSSSEPTRTNQKLNFRALPLDKIRHDLVPYAALGVENTLSIMLWPLYLGLFVLVTSSAYAKLGILSAVSVIISVVVAQSIGRMIDRRAGRQLLRSSALANAGIHLFRMFVNTYPLALGLSVANEAVTAGYRMPFLKGMFDAADDATGFRIVYLTSMEVFATIAKALAWWLLVVISIGFDARTTLGVGFVLAAAASCLIMGERFKALDRSA